MMNNYWNNGMEILGIISCGFFDVIVAVLSKHLLNFSLDFISGEVGR